MTIPTAGSHPELLNALIRECGLPLEQIIIVTTQPGVHFPEGVIRLEDHGVRNIQRWWTIGIDEAERRGASAVAVLNDDIRLTPQTLPALHQALIKSGAAISSPARTEFREGLHRRPLIPYRPRIWGSIWVLDLSTSLRPSQSYVWWYGDNDLDIRARRDYGGVFLMEVDYEHAHPSVATSRSAELLAQTDVDAVTFEREHARLLRMSRFITTWRRRLWLVKGDAREAG